jgi:hypothetical protein
MKRPLLALTAIFAAIATPAAAHHSFAMFDRETTRKIAGTVKEFTVVNPHSWLKLVAEDAQGKLHTWSFEFGGPNVIAHMGVKAGTFQPGDKLTISYHPLRDGSQGGQFAAAQFPDGHIVGRP